MKLNFFDLRRQPVGSRIWVCLKNKSGSHEPPLFVEIAETSSAEVRLTGEAELIICPDKQGIMSDNMVTIEGKALLAETERRFAGGATLGLE